MPALLAGAAGARTKDIMITLCALVLPLHDPAAKAASPRWFCIDIRYREHFPRPLTLGVIKATPALAEMVLLRQGRLSVQPVPDAEWRVIAALAGMAPP